MQHSFQGPLEIDRMFFPGEFSQWQYIPAFLFRAFTLFLAASLGWVQNIAYGTRSAGEYCKASKFSRLWHGSEQTASFLAKHVLASPACYAFNIKTIGAPQDSEAERYVTALHHFGQVKSVPPGIKWPENTAKDRKTHKRSRKSDVFVTIRRVKILRHGTFPKATPGRCTHPQSNESMRDGAWQLTKNSPTF
jgi:hypothetical protein